MIGFSLKMAQEAVDENKLWEVLEQGRNLMTEWPENRVDINGFHDGNSNKQGTVRPRDREFCSVLPIEFAHIDCRSQAAVLALSKKIQPGLMRHSFPSLPERHSLWIHLRDGCWKPHTMPLRMVSNPY